MNAANWCAMCGLKRQHRWHNSLLELLSPAPARLPQRGLQRRAARRVQQLLLPRRLQLCEAKPECDGGHRAAAVGQWSACRDAVLRDGERQ